ncbi:MAG: PD-(D/E)XK nuclease family protein [Desulfobacter sp.]|nr:MAG: PD-(D/E)XK nuclease family protein [Desulfobacter sp.]
MVNREMLCFMVFINQGSLKMISYQNKSYPFSKILGWSSSRYETFRICKRKYFYTYYSRFDTKDSPEKIQALKNLTSIPLSTGTIVHDIIKTILKRYQKVESNIDAERLKDYILNETKAYCKTHSFLEHHYDISKEDFSDQLFEDVFSKISTFIKSNSFSFILSEALPHKNEWVIEPGGFGETRIGGMKAYCKVDFSFPTNDAVYIYDWKTGKKSFFKLKNQMLGYAYWASEAFNIPKDRVFPKIAYLNATPEEDPIELAEKDIINFPEKVKKDSEEMYQFCSNIDDNIPIDRDSFSKTENIKICMNCNFRELCFA